MYDSLGRRVALSDPNHGDIRWEYDPNGNPQLVLFGAGCATGSTCREATFGYDPINRLVLRTYRDSGTSLPTLVHYDYGLAGVGKVTRLESVTYPGGTTFFGYDRYGRLSKRRFSLSAGDFEQHFRHDAAGRVTEITHPDGTVVTYGYDGPVLRYAMANGGLLFSIDEYWADYRPRSVIYNDGTRLTIEEDNLGRMKSETWSLVSNESRSLSYGYNVWGRVESVSVDGSPTRTFKYDGLGRLRIASDEGEFRYDEVGNILFHPSVGNYDYGQMGAEFPVHGVKRAGPYTLTYNSEGALHTLQGPGIDVTHEYDARGLLATRLASGGTVPDISTYTYDDSGRLVYRAIATNTGSHELLTLPAFSTRLDAQWVNAVMVGDEPWAIVRRGTCAPPQNCMSTEYLHLDRLGGVLFSTDENGHPSPVNQYSAFGDFTGGIWRLNGFAGGEADLTTYQLRMGARMYDPRLGRMLSADKMTSGLFLPQGLNRFSYAMNNPATLVDPSGLQSEDSGGPASIGGSTTMPFPFLGGGSSGYSIGFDFQSLFTPSDSNRSSGPAYVAAPTIRAEFARQAVSGPPSISIYSDAANPWAALASSAQSYWRTLPATTRASTRGIIEGVAMIGASAVAIALAAPVVVAGGATLAAAAAALTVVSSTIALGGGAGLLLVSAVGYVAPDPSQTEMTIEITDRYLSGAVSQ